MELLIFGLDIQGWLTGTGAIILVGFIVTFLRKKGMIFTIKKVLGIASVITEEIGEAFLSTSDFAGKANEAISNDGKLKENSVKDVIAAGKEAVIEWKDVVMTIKPKK